MTDLQTDSSPNAPDVVLIADAYLRQASSSSMPERIDAVAEADALRRCAWLFARRPRLLAIAETYDTVTHNAYTAAGFQLIHLNGDRAQALPALVNAEISALTNAPPHHLIVVSGDPAFIPLVRQAAQQQTAVLVWWSGDLPAALAESACVVRDLERDVLPAARRAPRVAIYIDYENIHIGLERQGRQPSPQAILQAVRAESADLGRPGEIHAYADWQALCDEQHGDVQRELVKLGVKTHYQIGRHGKNCADMEITVDVCAALDVTRPGVGVDTFVLVTGDRDLAPVARRVRQQGKRLRILTLRQCLAHELKECADEVRTLDHHFAPSTEGAQLTALLRVAAYLRQHDFDWALRERLIRIMQGKDGELMSRRILDQLVAQGCLIAGPSARPGSLALNQTHPLTQLALAIYAEVSACCRQASPTGVTTDAMRRCLQRRLDKDAQLCTHVVDVNEMFRLVVAACIVLSSADDSCWRLAVIEDECRRQAA
ncbi:MAG TPA: hypothetical protein DCL15_18375 [Chloroflexi bacterium]|nr:hypothetical protein [Chloroflexota bacterium]HHW88966.1 NYN domain-containing protein [Chloroflexota bacterium]